MSKLFAYFLIDGGSYELHEQICRLWEELGALTGERVHIRLIGDTSQSDKIFLDSLSDERRAALLDHAEHYVEQIVRKGREPHHVLTETAKLMDALDLERGNRPCLVFIVPGSREVVGKLRFDPDWYRSEERRWSFLDEILRWFESRILVEMLKEGIDPDILRLRLGKEMESLGESIDAAVEAIANPAAAGLQVPVRLKLPKGTTWSAVTISRLDDQRVRIRVGGVVRNLNFTQMGMVDHRDATETEQWGLLQAFLERGGVLAWSDSKADRKNQKRKEILARTLRALSGIEDDPFKVIEDEKDGRPRRAWQARFQVPPPA